MAGLFTITVPEAGTNLCTNPSFGVDTTGWASSWGDTIALITGYSRYGINGLQITAAGAASWGVKFDATVIAGSPCSVSIWVRMSGNWDGSDPVLKVYDGAAFTTLLGSSSAITERAQWVKRTVINVTPATTTLRVALFATIDATAGRTGILDGVLIQQANHITTYIDGDQPGCAWNGIRHGSTSTRDAQYRLAGREYNFDSFSAYIKGFSGHGMTKLQNNFQSLALLPGSAFLSTKEQARTLDLPMKIVGSSQADLHSKRKALIALIEPSKYRGAQPFLLGYNGASATDKVAYLQARYVQGFEGASQSQKAFSELTTLRLTAEQPYWVEDAQEQVALTAQDALAGPNYAFGRINGAWGYFGAGFSAAPLCMLIDQKRKRIYYGGPFASADAVTVNGFTYWNGTTFVAVGGATKGVTFTSAGVQCMALAPNGDVWVAGDLLGAGGSATKGIARYNVATDTFTVFNLTGTVTNFLGMTFDKNGKLFVCGNFTNWNGNANSNYVVAYDGTTWSNLGTGFNSSGAAAATDVDGTTIYFTGSMTTANGVTVVRFCKWTGTNFVACGSITNAGTCLLVMPTGIVYIGTSVDSLLYAWNGSAMLSIAVSSIVTSLAYDPSNNLIYVGYNSVSSQIYNGSIFFTPDCNFNTAGSTLFAVDKQTADLYLIVNGPKTLYISARTTVTPSSTIDTYPVIVLTGPTTAATSCTLNFIENQSTEQRIYFTGLTIQAGETLTIDFKDKTIMSDWRGNLIATMLDNSIFANWKLLSGANVIAAFVTGTLTGVNLLMNWQPVHESVDGVAA